MERDPLAKSLKIISELKRKLNMAERHPNYASLMRSVGIQRELNQIDRIAYSDDIANLQNRFHNLPHSPNEGTGKRRRKKRVQKSRKSRRSRRPRR